MREGHFPPGPHIQSGSNIQGSICTPTQSDGMTHPANDLPPLVPHGDGLVNAVPPRDAFEDRDEVA